jgi:hypothetical protein
MGEVKCKLLERKQEPNNYTFYHGGVEKTKT